MLDLHLWQAEHGVVAEPLDGSLTAMVQTRQDALGRLAQAVDEAAPDGTLTKFVRKATPPL